VTVITARKFGAMLQKDGGAPAAAAILAGCVATSLLVVLTASVPGPPPRVSFYGQVQTSGSVPCGFGCHATFQVENFWKDVSGGSVVLMYWYGAGPWEACGVGGTSGSCSYTSERGDYEIAAHDIVGGQPGQLVDFSGSY
jgi:hypothetical protein